MFISPSDECLEPWWIPLIQFHNLAENSSLEFITFKSALCWRIPSTDPEGQTPQECAVSPSWDLRHMSSLLAANMGHVKWIIVVAPQDVCFPHWIIYLAVQTKRMQNTPIRKQEWKGKGGCFLSACKKKWRGLLEDCRKLYETPVLKTHWGTYHSPKSATAMSFTAADMPELRRLLLTLSVPVFPINQPDERVAGYHPAKGVS